MGGFTGWESLLKTGYGDPTRELWSLYMYLVPETCLMNSMEPNSVRSMSLAGRLERLTAVQWQTHTVKSTPMIMYSLIYDLP